MFGLVEYTELVIPGDWKELVGTDCGYAPVKGAVDEAVG